MNQPEKFIHKSEIVRRHAVKTEGELIEVCKLVNARLKEADSLPIKFVEAEFGKSEWVRQEVTNRLKDAGWKVVFVSAQPIGDKQVLLPYYRVE